MKKLLTLLLTILMINLFILSGCTKSEDEKLMNQIRQEFKDEENKSKKQEKDEIKSLENSNKNSTMLNGISLEFKYAYLLEYKGENFLAISILKDQNLKVPDLRHSYEEKLYGYNNGSEKEIKINQPTYMVNSVIPYDNNKENLYLLSLDWDGYEEFKFEIQYKSTPAGSSHSVLDSVEFIIKNKDIVKTTFEEFNLIRFEESIQAYDKKVDFEDIQVELLDLSSDKITLKIKNTGDFPSESKSLRIYCYNKNQTSFLIQNSKIYFTSLNPNEETIMEVPVEQRNSDKLLSINTNEPVLLDFNFLQPYSHLYIVNK